jgi:hypothetical protein
MKRHFTFLRVFLVLLLASTQSFALVRVERITKEKAEKEFDATVRTEPAGTNQMGVRLEFALQARLKTFSSVQLEITSNGRKVVSATLEPSRLPDRVVVYFSTAPEYLAGSRFIVYYKISGGFPPFDGIEFAVADFIKHEPSP